MIRYLIFTAFSLFVAVHSVNGQTISGKVSDSRSKLGLAGVNIIVEGTSTGAVSDGNGHYSISIPSIAKPILKFSFTGYQSEEIRIEFGQKIINITLKPDDIIGETVEVNAYRVNENSAIAFQTLSAEKIKSNNIGQDIPYLLNQSSSVVVTSDAGNGIGYSGLRIRGIDPARINVTINGIPWNDAESHGMYWVDLPDLAASVDNIQIQRGVGTSTNGPAAFGASIDLQTFSFKAEPYSEFTAAFGSYNTQKKSIQWGTGLLTSGWMLDGRISEIKSDGYIDRGWADLNSLYLSAVNYGENDILQFSFIRGTEKTYQSWNGVSESDLKVDRQTNYFTYDNQTDNYIQNHYQLHYKYSFSNRLSLNTSFFLVRGAGFYEEFKQKENLLKYGMDPMLGDSSGLIRRKWLDNSYYGSLLSAEYQYSDQLKLIFGGGFTNYIGDHYGEVIWAELFVNRSIRHRYYDDTGRKSDLNLYSKFIFSQNSDIIWFADIQYRLINYEFYGFSPELSKGNQTDQLNFINPKIGLTWKNNENLTTYFSVGKGSKEPTRDEYVNSSPQSRPKSETMIDLETGFRSEFGSNTLNMNIYYMTYDNQLILTGAINDVGEAVRTNVSKSYRSGIETEYGYKFSDNLEFEANLTLSTSSVSEFVEVIYNDAYDAELKTIFKNKPIAYSPQIINNSTLRYSIYDLRSEINTKYVGKQFLDNTGNSKKVLDAYMVTDLKFQYDISGENFQVFKNLNLTFAVLNLFNELYASNGYTFSALTGSEVSIYNYYFPQAERNFMFQARFSF